MPPPGRTRSTREAGPSGYTSPRARRRSSAKGNGPFALFGGTMGTVEEPVFTPIEMTIDGRKSSFRVPGHIEVALAPFTNPVSGEVQDIRVNMPKGFIFRSAQAARTMVMKLFGAGPLSFDHSGQNAFYARLDFA